MSEVVRSFNRAGTGKRRRRSGRRGGCGAWFVILLLLVLVSIWAAWTTRDSYSMARLIPADQQYQIFAGDLLAKRDAMARSTVWELAPEDTVAAVFPVQLVSHFGMPDWVLNNLVYRDCHASGRDLLGFGDLLFVTRMSRIGCLIEKAHRFVPEIARDYAGGLRLRAIPEAGLYYAVRGRILAVSPSRQALVRALTLTHAEAMTEEALEQEFDELGQDDLVAQLHLERSSPLGADFESATLALRLAPAGARLACRAQMRAECRQRLAGLLDTAVPTDLKMPPEGILSLSANLGKPVSRLWDALDELAGGDSSRQQALEGLRNAAEEMLGPESGGLGEGLARSAGLLMALAGPGIRLSWRGVDALAMLPVPEIVGTFDTNAQHLRELFEALPMPPAGVLPWETFPRYSPEEQVLRIPMIGGPSIEATLAIYGDGLLVSTSRSVADEMLAADAAAKKIGRKGNLYLRCRPYPCAKAVYDTALEFAEFGALRGYTTRTLETAMAPWFGAAKRVREASALAVHEDGAIRMEFRIEMAAVEEPAN